MKIQRTYLYLHSAFLLCFILTLQSSWGEIPSILNYQGVLRDSDGNPLNGTFKMHFTLYNSSTGSIDSAKWEEIVEQVRVDSGFFNVNLGENKSLKDVLFNETYWLGLEINNEGKLIPLTKIVPSAYSLNTRTIPDGIVTPEKLSQRVLTSLLPVGTILPSMLDTVQFNEVTQSGWVLADGRNVNGSIYFEITRIDTVPDLRGMFLRGLNVDRNDGKEDPGLGDRKIGSFQDDLLGSHSHDLETNNDGSPTTSSYKVTAWTKEKGSNVATFAAGGSETRPNNISVYFYIKIN